MKGPYRFESARPHGVRDSQGIGSQADVEDRNRRGESGWVVDYADTIAR
jgi:hypothetical protein